LRSSSPLVIIQSLLILLLCVIWVFGEVGLVLAAIGSSTTSTLRLPLTRYLIWYFKVSPGKDWWLFALDTVFRWHRCL
jgi:hypothetical protein